MRPVIMEATALLRSRIGEERAEQFKSLLYRIILGLNSTSHEYYGELRRLKPKTPEYDAAHLYRGILIDNPQASRMSRAAYAWFVKGNEWFNNIREAAEWYMVSVEDMRDLRKYWASIGSPSLRRCLKPADMRAVNAEVSLHTINPNADQVEQINRIAWSLINKNDFRYLWANGYTTAEDLQAVAFARGTTIWMVNDWMTEPERFMYARRAMTTRLIDHAKELTARCRTRALRHINEDTGESTYTTQVINIESFAHQAEQNGDGGHMDPWERVQTDPTCSPFSNMLEDAEIESVIERIKASGHFDRDELRIVYALFGHEDSDIEKRMDGYDVEDYLEWLCDELEVDFRGFSNKLLKFFGVKREIPTPAQVEEAHEFLKSVATSSPLQEFVRDGNPFEAMRTVQSFGTFSRNEARYLCALLGVPDAKIVKVMDGYNVADYLNWLAKELHVDEVALARSLMGNPRFVASAASQSAHTVN